MYPLQQNQPPQLFKKVAAGHCCLQHSNMAIVLFVQKYGGSVKDELGNVLQAEPKMWCTDVAKRPISTDACLSGNFRGAKQTAGEIGLCFQKGAVRGCASSNGIITEDYFARGVQEIVS